jgi:hypothetical protein
MKKTRDTALVLQCRAGGGEQTIEHESPGCQMTRTKSKSGSTVSGHSVGLIPPAEMFERALPGPCMPDAGLPFEERVERAWRRFKALFREDEHERVGEMLVDLIKRTAPTDVQPQEPSK